MRVLFCSRVGILTSSSVANDTSIYNGFTVAVTVCFTVNQSRLYTTALHVVKYNWTHLTTKGDSSCHYNKQVCLPFSVWLPYHILQYTLTLCWQSHLPADNSSSKVIPVGVGAHFAPLSVNANFHSAKDYACSPNKTNITIITFYIRGLVTLKM